MLGALIGFLPGFGAAPGLYVLLVSALVILNANLFIAGVVLLLSKLLYLVLLPVSFFIGRALIDGPLASLFEFLINAPVTAWFGFQNYVATGGLVIGLLVGAGFSTLIWRTLQGFRRKMAALEQDSEAFQQWTAKLWVRILAWLFIGGVKGKQSFKELSENTSRGNPIRLLGAAIVVGLAVLMFVGSLFLNETIVTFFVRSSLERVNGATVDLSRVELKPGEARVVLYELAMTNPEQLDRNLLSASSLSADISARSILSKKVALDEVIVIDGSSGEKRAVPGRLTEARPEPPKEEPEAKTIEDYIKPAKAWQQRLALMQEWLEKVSPPETDEATEEATQKEATGPSLKEQLEARAQRLGYAKINADHRIVKAPTLLIRLLKAEGVKVDAMPDTRFMISGQQISTQPWLNQEPARIEVRSVNDQFAFDWTLPINDSGRLDFHLREIPMQEIKDILKQAESLPVTGGSVSISADGVFAPAALDLPLQITLNDTQVSGTTISQLTLPVTLSGSLSNPRIGFSDDSFQTALKEAGKGALINRLKGEGSKVLQEETDSKVKDAAGGFLKGIIGDDKDKGDGE